MSEAPVYPTAREVAVAIVTAARLHGDDPVLTAEGATSHRGRWLATCALQEAFPDAPHDWIAGACGVMGRSRCQNARAEIRSKRFGNEHNRAKWFLETDLKIVEAALAAAVAKTDAEIRNSAPAPIFVPIFAKSDVLEAEVPDFSHLKDARDCREAAPPKPVSAAARGIADFQRPSIIKTSRGHVIDHTQVGMVDMGDPPPGRSALDQRGSP